MRLVIAEKPSVAQSLAVVLGAGQRREGYLEGGGWLVSWCVGHLAELADAAAYDPAYAKWRKEDLPILPERWRFTISPDKRDQFDTLRTLLRREDVAEVVNACDAGREGELIFRTVYALAGCSKPISRLWISSMEDEAIREGFAHLRPGREYDGLHQAALCRSKADWLVGINATRLFSLLYGCTLNIGRVVSPTLGAGGPAGGGDRRISAGDLLHGGAGLRRSYPGRGAKAQQERGAGGRRPVPGQRRRGPVGGTTGKGGKAARSL